MDKPISVGDLVQVIRACCADSEKFLGLTFIARQVPKGRRTACQFCDVEKPGSVFCDDAKNGYMEWRLKRIPPPEELGIVDEREELTA